MITPYIRKKNTTHLRPTLRPHPCGVAGGLLHPEHLGVDAGLGDDAGTDDAGRLAEPSAARGEKHWWLPVVAGMGW